jgi:excisionase family DNA binding protein
MQETLHPIGYSIREAVGATGGAVPRTTIYKLIKEGRLDARKSGRRTIVLADSLRKYVENLPPARRS